MIFAIAIAFAPTTHASTGPCDYLNPIIQVAQEKPAIFPDNFSVFNYQKKKKTALQQATQNYYILYRELKLQKFSHDCFLQTPSIASHEDEFNELIPVTFLNASVSELSKIATPTAQKFYQVVQSRLNDGTLLGIRLIGHEETGPTNDPAGYKRGGQSIFMSLDKIKGSEWLLVITHELLHAIDPMLAEGTDVFGSELSLQVEALVKSKTNWNDLSESEKQSVDRLLFAGLERGFIAEVRAWAGTLRIYEEGRGTYFPAEISWMNSLTQSTGPTILSRVVKALDPNFTPKTTWIFAFPMIQERMKSWRDEFRATPDVIGEII